MRPACIRGPAAPRHRAPLITASRKRRQGGNGDEAAGSEGGRSKWGRAAWAAWSPLAKERPNGPERAVGYVNTCRVRTNPGQIFVPDVT